MRTGYLKLIIGVITVALIGIVAIQVYWVKNALNLKEQDFRQTVNRILVDVAHQVEKDEAIEFLKNHQLSEQFVKQLESLPLNNDTVDWLSNDHDLHMDIESKGYSKGTYNHFDSEFQDELIRISKENPVLQRQGVFQQILIDFLQKSPNPDVLQRLNIKRVHDLIKESLIHHGIDTKFHFAIVGMNNQIAFQDKQLTKEVFTESNYRVKLFGNDYMGSPNYLSLYFPHRKGFIMRSMAGIMSVSVVFILAICWTFWYTIKTIYSQKKLAIIKNDFINNMTHEFKTPISTISLACEMLGDDSFRKSETQYHKYLGMIHNENKRLGNLVERVLQSAVLDKGDFKIKREEVSVHELLDKVIESTRVKAQSKGGDIHTNFAANNDRFEVDKVHLSNVFYNLLDNAIKYTKERPDVFVYTKDSGNDIVIGVKDNGVGIKPEDQQKIFDKLYRVPTGNVHDVKGFGLGLSYVKAIIQKHGAEIKVESKVGHGTTFEIKLLKKLKEDNYGDES